jgi:farnesyl diphosphate synthase
LQALAFELLTPVDGCMSASVQAALCRLLARAAGHDGMAGGQAIDLASVGVALSEDQLRQMHRLKTGALLRGSVLMGVACDERAEAGAAGVVQALTRYGDAMGLAFQVVDDILDVITDTATLGKTAGKDAAAAKPTYVSLLGLDKAKAYAQALYAQAIAALDASGLDHAQTEALRALAGMVVHRKK